MAANYTPRQLEILIGSDNQDWSAHYAQLSIGYQSLQETTGQGLIKITGELTINSGWSTPESVNPRFNASRWRPGQPVTIRARNDSNTGWIDPVFKYLLITAEPDPPSLTGGQLVVELGCKLAWADLFEFEDDQSGVTFGVAENCSAIASRLLQASEVAASEISLTAWPYSIDCPFGKDTQAIQNAQSFAAKAGELAWSNDARLLYQNPTGQIVDMQLNFTVGTPAASVAVGANDGQWEPVGESQQPTEVTRCAGKGFITQINYDPSPPPDETIGDLSDVVPGAPGNGIIQRTTYSNSVNGGDPGGSPAAPPTKVSTRQLEQRQAAVFQNPSAQLQLIVSETETETETYEGGLADATQARLLTTVTRLEVREGSRDPSGVQLQSRDVYRRTVTNTYDANDVVALLTDIEEEAEIVHDPDSQNKWTLRPVRSYSAEMLEISPGVYSKKELFGEARIIYDSAVDKSQQNIWAFRYRSQHTKAADSPSPPPTVRFDNGLSKVEKHYSGEADYTHRGGATGRTRNRSVEVPFGFSDTQMTTMAEKCRDLFVGRWLGDAIQLELTDALLTLPPLPQVSVLHNSSTFVYLADSLSFEFTERQASAACSGIWISGGYA